MSRLEISTVGYATYPMRTGEIYIPQTQWRGTTFTIVVNTLYGVPFQVPYQSTWDRIVIEVTTLAALANARLGIYRNGSNNYPGTLLLDAGTVSVATTGVKTITISQALNPGQYWLAVVSDGGPIVRAGELPLLSPLGVDATNLSNLSYQWSVAFTYAALPDPFTASGAIGLGTNIILEGLRLLSVP